MKSVLVDFVLNLCSFIFMKNVFILISVFILFVACSAQDEQKSTLEKSEYPFMILRMMTRATENVDYQNKLLESLKDYPNTFDEVWLSRTSYLASVDEVKADGIKMSEVAKKWEDAGISAGYQLGTTLGHCATRNTYGFTDVDFKISDNGKKLPYLCPSSPKVKTYFYERVKALISTLKLSSYWLDDDFRTGLNVSELCCCPRCIEKFNALKNTKFTRKELVQAYSKDSKLLKEWVEFHDAILCELAQEVAKARNEADVNCRLGIQTINPFNYNYQNVPALVDALAGGQKTSIRIGSGNYEEFVDRILFHKMMGVMYEVQRCKDLKNIGQICYEAENYPHISMQKTPRAMMLECSLMLASGCDSLALYWHDVIYEEPLADYKNFARVVNQWRPYFKRVADLNKGTRLWGIGKYVEDMKYNNMMQRGENRYLDLYPDDPDYAIMHTAFPLNYTKDYPDVILLTETTIGKMSVEQIKKLLAKKCMVDHKGLNLLKSKGIDVRVQATKTGGSSIFHSRCYESYKGKRYAMKYEFFVLTPTSTNVKPISDVVYESGEKVGLAMCVVDTEFGGKLFVVGGNGITKYPTAYRRSAILDGLDALSPMPVRMETSHACVFLPRVDDLGEFANATIYNYTRGDTLPIKLRIRSKQAHKYRVIFPDGKDVVVKSKKSKNDDGYILNLPSLAPVSVMTIYREN